jgi:hypothetical protein
MIAPPASAFLKAKPFRVRTQTDFLIEAATRLIGGLVTPDGRRYTTSTRCRSIHRTEIPFVLNAGASL